MKARRAFNLFLVSFVFAVTLWLLNAWGRPEWFSRFPLSYALRMFNSVRVYATCCAVFFAALALIRARGRPCRGRAYGALFSVCFVPLFLYSALTLARVDLDMLEAFLLADGIVSVGVVAAVAAVSALGRRDGLPLYVFYVRPEILPPPVSSKAAELYALSPRESEVLALLLQGKTNREIADDLFISLPTVKTHLAGIFGKMGVRNRLEACARCVRPYRPEE